MTTTLDFPASPTLNQIYTSGSKNWRWNGTAWRVMQKTIVAPTVAVGNVTTVANGVQPTVVNSGNTTNAVLDFSLPTANGGFKNRIINPKLRSWQAGTSITFSGSNNSFGWGVDRFLFQAYSGPTGTGNNTITQSQQSFIVGQTDVPTNPFYFARTQCSLLGTQAAGAFIRIIQYIEDVYTLQGQQATISFWARCDTSRTIAVGFQQNFGTGGSAAVFGTGALVSVTGSWARYSVTVNIPSITGMTVGANNNLLIGLYLHNADPNVPLTPNNWSTSAWLDFWGLQVEAGATMTDFEDRNQTLEDLMIKRYVTTSKSQLSGIFRATNIIRVYNDFEVPMRRTPDVGILNPSISMENPAILGYTMTGTTVSLTNGTERRMMLEFSGTSSPASPTSGTLCQLNTDKAALFRAEF